MAAATPPQKAAATARPLVPPEERFWKRYSPHFELPLAGMSSLLLHGLVIGAIVLATATYFFRGGEENVRPPSMDVVMMGGSGDGEEGAGGEPGSPGEPGQENVASLKPDAPGPEARPELPADLKNAAPFELTVPDSPNSPETVGEDVFQKLSEAAKKEAERAEEKKLPAAPPKKAAGVRSPSKGGTGNPKGAGGQGGSGGGPGRGTKGTGTGAGGGPGRTATRAEVLAWRWRFNLQGGAREHADKLAAIGVTVAVPDPRGGFLMVQDLKRRPVDTRRDDLAAFKDAVKWYNTDPNSVKGLANELQLPFVPQHVILLLPKDREEKMAAEEARFAKEHRRTLTTVRATWFDFQLRGGGYEPLAIRQE